MTQPDNNPNLLRQVAQRLDQIATEEDVKRILKHILRLRCEVNKLSQTEGSELKSRLEIVEEEIDFLKSSFCPKNRSLKKMEKIN